MEVDLLSFLLSVVFVSLSGVMMPGPVFAVTVAKGYRSKVAGVLIALGHGAIAVSYTHLTLPTTERV